MPLAIGTETSSLSVTGGSNIHITGVTVDSGHNTLCVRTARQGDSGAPDITSMTWNGTSLTNVVYSGTGDVASCDIWTATGVTPGTADLIFSSNHALTMAVVCTSIGGVNTNNPYSTGSGASTTAPSATAPTIIGDFVLDIAVAETGSLTAAAGQTLDVANSAIGSGTSLNVIAGHVTATGSSTVDKYTVSPSHYAAVATIQYHSSDISLVTHNVTNLQSNAVTSAAQDTTGASLLVAITNSDIGNGLPTITDNKGNTWHPLTSQSNGIRDVLQIVYAWNPTVGSGHTVTATSVGTMYGVMEVAAFRNVQTNADPFDVQNGAKSGASDTSIAPGPITPSLNNELLVTAMSIDDPGSNTITITGGGNYTILDTVDVAVGSQYGLSSAYLVQTTATGSNPRWNRTTTNTQSGDAAVIASFKAATGTTSVSAKQAGATGSVGTVVITGAGPNISGSQSGATGSVGTVTVTAGSNNGEPQIRRFGEIQGATLIIGPSNITIY